MWATYFSIGAFDSKLNAQKTVENPQASKDESSMFIKQKQMKRLSMNYFITHAIYVNKKQQRKDTQEPSQVYSWRHM